MHEKSGYLSEMSCLLTGLGTGLALGVLLAPRSRKENRRLIRHKTQAGKDLLKSTVHQGQDYIKERGTEVLDQANELVDRGKSAIKEQKDQLTGAVEAGIQAYREAVDAAKSAG